MRSRRLCLSVALLGLAGLVSGTDCTSEVLNALLPGAGGGGSEPDPEPPEEPPGPEPVFPRVRITVEYTAATGDRVRGNFVIELNDELAPISTENFLKYVDSGFYDNTVFHRADTGLGVVQGGGFVVDQAKLANQAQTVNEEEPDQEQEEEEEEEEDPFKSQPLKFKPALFDPIKNEDFNGLRNLRGSVGVARTGDPDSGNSQWYVNTRDNPGLDPTGAARGFAVFGQVVGGMSIVDQIQVLPTEPREDLLNVPVHTVLLLVAERM